MRVVSPEEVKKRVVRFPQIRPLWGAYDEAHLPAHQRALYRYFGNQASDAVDVPPAVAGLDVNVAIVTAGPGKGAPLHDHECEEIFFALKGDWGISFGEKGEEEVILHEWDAVSIPPGINRAFRNAGTQDGFLMAILGSGVTELPKYRADYSKLPKVVKR